MSGETMPGSSRIARRVNLAPSARWLRALLGVVLMFAARRRGTAARAAAALAGGMIVGSAATGHSRLYDRLGVSSASLGDGAGIGIETSVRVMCSPAEAYAAWRDPGMLTRFWPRLRVEPTAQGTLLWTASLAAGMHTSWETRIIQDAPAASIAWATVAGSAVEMSGAVRFDDAEEGGTGVVLRLRYVPPGGVAGFALGKAAHRALSAAIEEGMERSKRLLESADDALAEGETHGPGYVRRSEPGLRGRSQYTRVRAPVGERPLEVPDREIAEAVRRAFAGEAHAR